MFDLNFDAGNLAAFETKLVDEIVRLVRVWLDARPDNDVILKDLPALELALAAHIKNHDTELLSLAIRALKRVNANLSLEAVSNPKLAARIVLNLRAWQLTHDAQFENAARRAIELAKTRWDEEHAFFKPSATDTPNVFYPDANAQLGEAFFFAWRALKDETLRPIAGEVLGQVSRMFDPNAHLYGTDALPSANETRGALGTRAAALQFFLTASETTGRRTYMTRACILGDDALKNLALSGTLDQRVKFADALLRLERFTNITRYRDTAREILKNATLQAQAQVESATLALSIEHANHFPLHVVIIGDAENDENTKALWFAAMNEYASARAIELLHPTQHAARLHELGYFTTDEHAQNARAYICIGTLVLPSVSSVDAFHLALERARNQPTAY